MLASVFIAAAGYIINDYFDLNIDQVNKPDKNVFVKTINRRWAIIWHFALSLMGIVATIAAIGLHKWYLILANLFCIALLWVYSTSLKKKSTGRQFCDLPSNSLDDSHPIFQLYGTG